MKNRLIPVVLFSLFFACDSLESIDQSKIVAKPTFQSSVAIVSRGSAFKSKFGKVDSSPLIIELINFDKDFRLPSVLKVDDVEYCDNGKFNDEISGDGVYTSVNLFAFDSGRLDTSNKIAFSPDFGYKTDLQSKLSKFSSSDNLSKGKSVTIGCDIVERPCPQTEWYNTCWFSDTCTCVYLENCHIEITFEF